MFTDASLANLPDQVSSAGGDIFLFALMKGVRFCHDLMISMKAHLDRKKIISTSHSTKIVKKG